MRPRRREPAAVPCPKCPVPSGIVWLRQRSGGRQPRCCQVSPGRGELAHPRSPRSAGCEARRHQVGDRGRGSSPVTRLSPTSTASAPAAAYASRSCGPRIPDSAILTMPSGTRGASRFEHAAVDLERGQVARVDAEDPPAPGVQRTVRQFVLGVHLDQRNEVDRQERSTSETRAFCSSGRNDQQHHVCPVRPRLPELVRADDEVLAHRTGTCTAFAHRGQVLQAAAEPPRLGEDADHAGTAAARQSMASEAGSADRGQRALGRLAGTLDFGDDGDVPALERGDDVACRGRLARGLLRGCPAGRGPLPCREVGTYSLEDPARPAQLTRFCCPLGWDALRPRS